MRDRSLWTWHVAAGAVIAVLLGVHMSIMHLDALLGWYNNDGHPIEWQNVLARAKGAGFMASYVLLLGAALFHGLFGLRGILFELNPRTGLKQAITVVVVLGGVGLFAFGTWSAVASFRHAQVL